jgi:hypothetical protein
MSSHSAVARACSRVGSFALLLCTLCIAAHAAGTPSVAEASIRPVMVRVAAQMVRAEPQLATIWPGYWRGRQPFIIYHPGDGALLVSAGERPDSFQPLEGADAPLKGRAFWHSGSLPEVKSSFVTNYSIGSGKTAILGNAAAVDVGKVAGLLLHEQFHVYQAKAFRNFGFAEFVAPLTIPNRVVFAASAETERRILAKAIETEDARGRLEFIQQYFALRRAREAATPAQAVEVERNLERIEGTARYVDRVALAMLGAGRLETLLVTELHRPLASEPGGFATNWFRMRSYGTGAAIAYLISRLDKGDWRGRIEAGAMPDALLESLVQKPAPGAAAALARGAKASFGYDAILRDLGPAIEAGEKAGIKSVEAFLAGAPYRLVLDATTQVGNADWHSEMAQLGPQILALPHAKTFSYSAPSVALATTNLSVLMEGERYTVLLPSPPRIAGLSASAFGEHRLNALALHGDGVDLKIDRLVVVTISESEIVVRLPSR